MVTNINLFKTNGMSVLNNIILVHNCDACCYSVCGKHLVWS